MKGVRRISEKNIGGNSLPCTVEANLVNGHHPDPVKWTMHTQMVIAPTSDSGFGFDRTTLLTKFLAFENQFLGLISAGVEALADSAPESLEPLGSLSRQFPAVAAALFPTALFPLVDTAVALSSGSGRTLGLSGCESAHAQPNSEHD